MLFVCNLTLQRFLMKINKTFHPRSLIKQGKYFREISNRGHGKESFVIAYGMGSRVEAGRIQIAQSKKTNFNSSNFLAIQNFVLSPRQRDVVKYELRGSLCENDESENILCIQRVARRIVFHKFEFRINPAHFLFAHRASRAESIFVSDFHPFLLVIIPP